MFIRNILSFLRIYYVVIEQIILDRNRKLEVTQLQPPRKEEKSCPEKGIMLWRVKALSSYFVRYTEN